VIEYLEMPTGTAIALSQLALRLRAEEQWTLIKSIGCAVGSMDQDARAELLNEINSRLARSGAPAPGAPQTSEEMFARLALAGIGFAEEKPQERASGG
jgi:hypothetical protein